MSKDGHQQRENTTYSTVFIREGRKRKPGTDTIAANRIFGNFNVQDATRYGKPIFENTNKLGKSTSPIIM